MTHAQSYKMSFTTGGLFLNESLVVARLWLASASWPETRAKAVGQGAASQPKEASRRRTLREIINRLSCLSDGELRFLCEGADRGEQAALLWLAVCRAYRLVREYAVDVIQDRHVCRQFGLPVDSFNQYIAMKSEWNDGLSRLSPATILKLRQVLFRIMREASIINDENNIISAYLSPRLRHLITQTDPADLNVFPGIAFRGSAL